MKKQTYWSSQSLRTLNHWQSNIQGEPFVPTTAEWFSGLKQGDSYYPIPPSLNFSGGTLVYDQDFSNIHHTQVSTPFNFNNMQPIRHVRFADNDKVVIMGAFNYDEQELQVYPSQVASTREVRFNCGDIYASIPATQNAMTLDVAVPTVKRICLVYAWCKPGYERQISEMPQWVWATDTISTYTPYEQTLHGITVNGFTNFNLSTEIYNVNKSPIMCGLTDTLRETINYWYKKCLIPRGYETFLHNEIQYCGCISGFNSGGSGVLDPMVSFPTNEPMFVDNGSTSYINSGTRLTKLSHTIFTGCDSFNPTMIRTSTASLGTSYLSYGAIDSCILGSNPNLLFLIQWDGHIFSDEPFQNFIEKRYFDGNTQIGAMYFSIVNMTTKVDIKRNQIVYVRS